MLFFETTTLLPTTSLMLSLAARRDFRDEKTFTIDPNGANELDDAIHVKTEVDGKIEIGIHIADVAHFIKANSLVDREARKRSSAVYLSKSLTAISYTNQHFGDQAFFPLMTLGAVLLETNANSVQ
jgi:exoribonuclease R